MKKILAMAAVALIMTSAAAMAQDGPKGPHDGPGKHGEKMFEKLDADGNGSVSKEEFMKVQEEHFAKMDANGDGQFTKDEAEAMKAKMREMRQKWKEQKGQPPAGDAPAPDAPAEDAPAE